jgi:cellobiose-specific phosphotransferase system component IIA
MGKSGQGHYMRIVHIEVLSRAAPVEGRVNEDAWLILELPAYPGFVVMTVIDGASMRVPLPPLMRNLQEHYPGLTPAAYAAHCLRASLIDQLAREPACSLSAALLTANETLRQTVAQAVGSFDAAEILAVVDAHLGDDWRNVRLVLPACVVTLARLDLAHRQLEYAHLGDTSLVEIRRNGETVRHTTDQMGPFDSLMLQAAAAIQQNQSLPHFQNAVRLPEIRKLDIQNGLRHNYVNSQGRTDQREGCGVINGLPEAADYIEMGTVAVDPEQTLGFFLLSDGLELLSVLQESVGQREQRLCNAANIVQQSGLRGLYAAVSKMAQADPYYDQYPRGKLQDDATGIYLQFAPER